jgi:hypothetical protein
MKRPVPRLREFLREYDEELYQKQLEDDLVQARVDLAESIVLKNQEDCLQAFIEGDYYDDREYGLQHGQDDFGHEYYGEDDEPFEYLYADEDYPYRDEEERYNP